MQSVSVLWLSQSYKNSLVYACINFSSFFWGAKHEVYITTIDIEMILDDLLLWCISSSGKSFSMLRSCITNLCTIQHGHPGYLRALQKCHVWMIQVVLINCIFLTWRTTKSAERCQILDWCQSKLFKKYLISFPLPDVVQHHCLYMHPLEIQPNYVISCLRGNPCKNKIVC